MHCLLSDINLNLKLQRENVPKVGGVVNQVSYRRGVQFYAFSVQIFPRSFGCGNFIQIDQILSMYWHLVPYGTLGPERVNPQWRDLVSPYNLVTEIVPTNTYKDMKKSAQGDHLC